jgi:type I restriction enzyme S subunit
MSWRKVKLGELVENFSVRAKDVGGADGLEFFGVSNETGITTTKYAAEEKAEDYKIIEQGCFAYNPYRVNVGSIGLLTENIKGLISPAYVVFKPKPKSIKPELLLKFLKSSEGLRQIKLYARGTVRQALRFEDLCNIELSLPDYDTQNELLQKLNTTQNCAEEVLLEQSHQLDLIKKLRQQILKDAMQGKLVPQNPKDEPATKLLDKIKAEKTKSGKKEKPLPEIKPEEIPFEIPESWAWCRLGELGHFRRGPFGSALTKGIFVKDGYKVYEQRNAIYDNHTLGDYYVTKEKFQELKGFQVQPKDLIVSCSGATLGRIAEIPDNAKKGIINQALMRITLYQTGILNSFFVKLFRSPYMQYHIFEKAWGTAIPNMVGLSEIKLIPIPLPPLSEQKRIVSKIEELMTLCDELEASVKANQEYTTLLYQTALKEALQPKAIEIKQEDLAIAAEPKATYFSQKNLLDFYQKQIIGHIVKQHNEHKMQQGEMVIAKDLYHLEKLYGINTHFQFQNWHYGTYDNKIRQLITGKDKYFKKEKVGNKGYEVLALGEKSENLFNPKYHKPELDLVEQSMKDLLKIYSTFPIKERSKRIELLNTVSKVISDTQSLDLKVIREAMKQWKTPKAKFPTKADSFTLEETKECIDLILKKGWDKKLIH